MFSFIYKVHYFNSAHCTSVMLCVCVQVHGPLLRSFLTSLYWQRKFTLSLRHILARGISAQTDKPPIAHKFTWIRLKWHVCFILFLFFFLHMVKPEQPTASVCVSERLVESGLASVFLIMYLSMFNVSKWINDLFKPRAYPWYHQD